MFVGEGPGYNEDKLGRPFVGRAGDLLDRLLSRNEIAAVSDLVLSGRHLLAAFPGRILRVELPDTDAPVAAARVEVTTAPLGGSLRFATSPEGEVWVWDIEAERGELLRLEPESPEGEAERIAFPGPIRSAAWSGPELCVVEGTGRCSILLRVAGVGPYLPVFEFHSPGANALASTGRAVLIGKSTLQRGDSPLLLVDRRTGETAQLSRGEGLVYELIYEPETDSVLSLGVSRDPSVWSSLARNGGTQYLESRLLVEYRGEDTGGDIVRSAEGVYTSLGFTVARLESSAPPARQQSPLRSPRRLAFASGVLASLNLDGSITIWRQADLEPVADLVVFRDGEWLLTASGVVAAASAGGARYVSEER